MSIGIWIGFFVLVLILLAIDLGVTDRHPHEIKVKEALIQTAIWIAISLLFCLGIYIFDGDGYFNGGNKALEFLTAYLIEKSLSMDKYSPLFFNPNKQAHTPYIGTKYTTRYTNAVFNASGDNLCSIKNIIPW